MKIQRLYKSPIISLTLVLVLATLMVFSGCGKAEDDPQIVEGSGASKDYTDVYIERLNTLVADLTAIYESAVFGDKANMYPASSKNDIEEELAVLKGYLSTLQAGESKLTPTDMDWIIHTANDVKDNFLASVRTEDFQALPAELRINGTNGGYIDFGSSRDYADLGSQFTIELWFKFAELCESSFILTTFLDGGQGNWTGWGVNYYGYDGCTNLRNSYSMNSGNDLFEPYLAMGSTDAYFNEWMHLAFVWNSPKTNDDNPRTGKVYINGVLKSEGDFSGTYVPNVLTGRMIACARLNSDESIASSGGTSGCIKHVHIWKGVKTQTEIQNIINNPDGVTKDSQGLVCGWTFTNTVSDETAISDITGKYKAKLVGDYQWWTN